MSSRSRVIAFCIVGLALFGAPVPSPAADTERGRGLYEESCTACHAESVHARSKRVARNFGEIRGWVERWNATLGLRWGDEEVEDVTAYLNAAFYRYAVPAAGTPKSRTPSLLSSRPAAVPE